MWKRIAEKSPFVDKYQRFSKGQNQGACIRSVKTQTFKEASEVLETSTYTLIRRFAKVIVEQLPQATAIDACKVDTDAGTYQLIIVNVETHELIDILTNRKKETINHNLPQFREALKVVVMDMSTSFKAAVMKALEPLLIIADRFHYC